MPFTRALPAGLEALVPLALDLRWGSERAAEALWRRLAADVWDNTRSAWLVLNVVSQRQLDACAADAAFVAAVAEVERRRQAQLTAPPATDGGGSAPLVAYFCLEYGLAEALPLYSGGLGMLAGDHLKAASDLGLPMVGIGLLYQEGYFRQTIDADGSQRELYPTNVPGALPVVAERDADGAWLSVALRLPGRDLVLRVWRAQVGRVPLLLLDANDPLNSAADRGITGRLYAGGTETRFAQEVVLGIGGWRALEALGYRPQVCHLNEGHAAFVALERARSLMREHGLGFWDALWATRAGNVLTTHTPVAAAFDKFPFALVERYGRAYAEEIGLEPHALAALARVHPDDTDEPFNMTYLALRTVCHAVAVSDMHREVSRRLLQPLYPRRPAREVPIEAITNGVHVPSWISAPAERLWSKVDRGMRNWDGDPRGLSALDDSELWALAGEQRRALVAYARMRLARQLGQRGADAGEVAAAAHVLDPNALTLGFARRFTAYKRPNLLLADPDRLARLLGDAQRPLQLIVAGKAHPHDHEGRAMVRRWTQFCARPDVRARAVFLEDYDIGLAQRLLQGVDAWINTPHRPWEACGTSGMKLLANGGLNVSTLSGWWAEAYRPEAGWAIGPERIDESGDIDAADAGDLYDLIEREILPTFYGRDERGIPAGWVARMRASMAAAPRFSASRMLREYLQRAYQPAARAVARRCADGARIAVALRQWDTALRAAWHEVHFGNVSVVEADGVQQWRVQVYLGDIAPAAVAVELYADPRAGEPAICERMCCGSPIEGAANGYAFEARIRSMRPAADFTPRVVPCHADAVVPVENSLILWAPRSGPGP